MLSTIYITCHLVYSSTCCLLQQSYKNTWKEQTEKGFKKALWCLMSLICDNVTSRRFRWFCDALWAHHELTAHGFLSKALHSLIHVIKHTVPDYPVPWQYSHIFSSSWCGNHSLQGFWCCQIHEDLQAEKHYSCTNLHEATLSAHHTQHVLAALHGDNSSACAM